MTRIFLIRHAHRDTSQGLSDNGLSHKGQMQAMQLARYFEKRVERDSTAFTSSPKKRCQETLHPLSEILKLEVEVLESLDEGNLDEDRSAFIKRIDSVVRGWKKSKKSTLFVCTHGDWIPECMDLINGPSVSLKKAGFIELAVDGKEIKVVKVTQGI